MAPIKAPLIALWLLLLVVTGGASHPLRLGLLSLPLALARPQALPLIIIGLCLAIPSALELTLHGDWLGPFGARLRLIAGAVVAASAFCLGLVIRHDRPLRERCAAYIPVVCILLAIQAALGITDVLPPAARFLNGNHLAALALLLLAPALSLGLDTRARWISLAAIFLTLLLSTSRWGTMVGVTAALLLLAREYGSGRRRSLFVAVALVVPWGLWLLRSHFELSKLSLLRSLYPISEVRPWTGIGPEGLERLSLHFLVATPGRTTHAENIYLDWAASIGIPFTVLLITAWIAWCLWRLECDGNRTKHRMCRSSSLVLLFLLVHELVDFSLTSGAVASMAGFLVAWTVPDRLAKPTPGTSASRWLGACLTLTLPLLAWQFDPLRMERRGELESFDSRWGEHPHRIPWGKARRTDDPQERISLLANALKQAPGEGLLWLDFGDALYQSDRRTQAKEAYRHGFALLQDASRRRRGEALARSLEPEEVWQVLRPNSKGVRNSQIPAMVGAAQTVLSKGSSGYAIVRRSEIAFNNGELSRIYLGALRRPGLDPLLVMEESVRLLRRDPPILEAGTRLIQTITKHQGWGPALEIQRSLIHTLPTAGCKALGQWPPEEIHRLIPYRNEFLRVCGQVPNKDLHTENILSLIPRPVAE